MTRQGSSDRRPRGGRSVHDHEPAPADDGFQPRGGEGAARSAEAGDGPAHGYELGQTLARASGGAWKPSPGSMYPTLPVRRPAYELLAKGCSR